MEIREIEEKDAEQLATLLREVDQESSYMLWEPGERNLNTDSQLKMIQGIKSSANSTIFVAEEAERLVGYLLAIGGKARRNRHVAYLVIGILEDYHGRGIGTSLFKAMEKWAGEHHIHRLELTVVSKNKAAVALYKKMGFEIEGTKQDSLKIAGEFIDEFYMAKRLS